jgi:hypothetical protein
MLALRPLALVALLAAPLQCPSRVPPELAREDGPDEALWTLSERFGGAGDEGARRATLRFLMERYPSSRFAVRASLALDGGAPTDAGR